MSRSRARRRLITIPISHFCERARWALDWAGLDYVEERHLQGFHARAVRRAGGERTVPVLVDDEQVLADSADIVAHADRLASDRTLYPPGARDAIESLERELSDDLGVESRRLAYFWFLAEPKLLLRYNNAGAPRYQRLALRVAFRPMRRFLSSYLDINPRTAARAVERITASFDAVERTAASGDYLFDDRFTAADLTFASMAAPVLLPPQYGATVPDPGALYPSTAAAIARFREHPAGRRALSIYERHRR